MYGNGSANYGKGSGIYGNGSANCGSGSASNDGKSVTLCMVKVPPTMVRARLKRANACYVW